MHSQINDVLQLHHLPYSHATRQTRHWAAFANSFQGRPEGDARPHHRVFLLLGKLGTTEYLYVYMYVCMQVLELVVLVVVPVLLEYLYVCMYAGA
jgi:hypothetical protein